jgi:hypothetical protein
MDNKQKEAEAKENDHSRCRDKAERDEGERGCDIGLRCPDPRSRGIGERNRCFGRPWTRVSARTSRPELSRQLVEEPLSEHSAAFPLTHPRIQAATGDRKAPALVMNHELPISVLAGDHPARPFAAIEPTHGKSAPRRSSERPRAVETLGSFKLSYWPGELVQGPGATRSRSRIGAGGGAVGVGGGYSGEETPRVVGYSPGSSDQGDTRH